ncbi:MAG: DUF488 family protein [bacterium]|nr:DUF488 family protein [bacterium]
MITTKSIYKPPNSHDGYRILVERYWPEGVVDEESAIDFWLQEIAPSDDLKKLYSGDLKKWSEFKAKYFEELEDKKSAIMIIVNRAREGDVTLLQASGRDIYTPGEAIREFIYRNYNL